MSSGIRARVGALFCVLLASLSIHAGAQSREEKAQRENQGVQRDIDRQQARELERLIEQSRNDFVSSLRRIPAGRSERARRHAFRADVRGFHDQLVGLWVLRFARMSETWARKDLEERLKDLGNTLERMRKYVDRDSDPPDFTPAGLDGQTLPERLDQLVMLGLELPRRIVEVTEGEVLDLVQLNDVRSDLASLEAWTDELRKTVKD